MVADAPEASFSREIAPLLQRHCVACHGAEQPKGRYRLDSFDALFKPGSSGLPSVADGQPEASELYRRLLAPDPDERMPQAADSLPAAEIAIIRTWILQGAHFDGTDRRAALATLTPQAAPKRAPGQYGQPWPVTALAFIPITDELSTAGCREVCFWEPHSGELQRRVEGMPERVHALAWQPGGRLLAVAGGSPGRAGEVLLWDASRNNPPLHLAGAADELLCTAFSPDGERLAVGGTDKLLRVFDVNSRQLLYRVDQHSDWVHATSFSADGRWLVSASRDRTARLHHSSDSTLLAIFRGHQAAVGFAVFNATGDRVLSGGADYRVRAWDSADGGKADEFARFDREITGLMASNSSLFIAVADGLITQRRLNDGAEECRLDGEGERIISLAWHPGLEWLAGGSHEGQIRLWDLKKGNLLNEFPASPGIPNTAHR